MFKGFLAKMECKTQCLFWNLNNSWQRKSHSPNGRVIDDLCSPDTFDTRLGKRASTNVTPCDWLSSLLLVSNWFGFGFAMVPIG